MKEKIIFSWSSGKDSAYALYHLISNPKYKIEKLFTTLSSEYKRVNFHSISPELMKIQAQSLNLPLELIYLSKSENIENYAKKLEPHFLEFKNQGINTVAFGDIYLEDLRKFRVNSLKKLKMEAIFPIWNLNTKEILKDFISQGFQAIITCIDTNVIDKSFLGQNIDENFINNLPENVDCCGENGEFHTFVYDGPIFKERINFSKGDILQINNFAYLEIK